MATTPPHHPTHNVYFSDTKITRILSHVYPDKVVCSIKRLESGKSFNNRLYFITLSTSADHDQIGQCEEEQEVVLKISGKFFGPDKVQNEVGILSLIEKFCPDAPVPRVLAWSEGHGVGPQKSNDRKLHVVVRNVGYTDDENHVITSKSMMWQECKSEDLGERCHGWILLSKQPGRVLTKSDLAKPESAVVMQQLATVMARLRSVIPAQGNRFGNIRITHTPVTGSDSLVQSKAEVDGLVVCSKSPHLIHSVADYYRARIKDQLTKLETEDVFALMKEEVSTLVRDFLTKMPDSEVNKRPVFTQYDFCPRNILVSDTETDGVSGLTLTSLVDFEFAGFCPEETEFANVAVNFSDNWDDEAYDLYLKELENLDVRTPLTMSGWNKAGLMMELIESIAPWFLREGGVTGDDLVRESALAVKRVKKDVDGLLSS